MLQALQVHMLLMHTRQSSDKAITSLGSEMALNAKHGETDARTQIVAHHWRSDSEECPNALTNCRCINSATVLVRPLHQ